MCEARGLPRIIFVNKMDRENADFLRSLESIRSAFGRKCVPIQAPVGAEQDFKSVVSLLGSEGDVPLRSGGLARATGGGRGRNRR